MIASFASTIVSSVTRSFYNSILVTVTANRAVMSGVTIGSASSRNYLRYIFANMGNVDSCSATFSDLICAVVLSNYTSNGNNIFTELREDIDALTRGKI